MKNDAIPDYWRERTIFPTSVPEEVKILFKNIKNIDKSSFRRMIKLALGYLQGTLSPEQCELAFENICNLRGCDSADQAMAISLEYAGVMRLLKAILKINLKTIRQELLTSDLIELGLPEEYAGDVCKVAFGPAHTEIFEAVVANNPQLPHVESLEWSTDVTLSNSYVSKVLDPSVSFHMTTSEGPSHSFEASVASFHLLRHSTAAILRHMEALVKKK